MFFRGGASSDMSSYRHSRESGNQDCQSDCFVGAVAKKPLDSRLRGNDGCLADGSINNGFEFKEIAMQWSEVIADPALRDLPYKIELNKWGIIEMSTRRAEKRFYRAFRRMFGIRRITPARRRRLIRPTRAGELGSRATFRAIGAHSRSGL
ncbi:MAG: hypothetical protein Q8Q28_13995 [Pseudomonadota bacterium]|nr:hypothetical protein [Pseudomonadota bacterium]